MNTFKRIVYCPFTFVLVAYVFLFSFINPFSNLVINDEWAHTRQVEAFLNHSWKVQSNTDASLILLAFAGYFVSLVFGYSLIKMKVLIFTSSVVFLFFTYKSLKLKLNNYWVITITLLTLVFNPLILHLSGVFMTDIPFLALVSASVFFFLKYIEESKPIYSYIGSFISGLSLLVRQLGTFVFLGWFVYKIIFGLKNIRYIKKAFAGVWKDVFIFALFFTIYFLYPRHGDSTVEHLFKKLFDWDNIDLKLLFLINSLFYLSYFLSPLILVVKLNISRNKWLVMTILSLIPAYYVYRNNVFPTGNILYMEGLYAKSSQFFYQSIINNSITRAIFSLFIGLMFLKLVAIIIQNAKRIIMDKPLLYLAITSIILYLELALPNDQYDRYVLPLTYFLVLMFSFLIQETDSEKFSIILLTVLIFFVNYFLVLDFTTNNKLRWQAAKKITQATGLKAKIYVNGAYTRYISSQKIKDYSGNLYVSTQAQYNCASETIFTKINSENLIENLSSKYSKQIEYVIGKPDKINLKIPTSLGIPRAKEYHKNIYFEQEYPSIFYNLFGYNVKVQGWCDKRLLETKK